MHELEPYLKVGKIRTAHGIHGAFKIELFSDDVARLAYLQNARLVNPHNPQDFIEVKLSLQGRKPETLILSALGIETKEAIMAYQNWYVEVERANAKLLAPGEYFVCDLINCCVVDKTHGEIGIVKDVLQNTSQDVLVISQKGQPDILLPKVDEFILQIDLAAGKIYTNQYYYIVSRINKLLSVKFYYRPSCSKRDFQLPSF